MADFFNKVVVNKLMIVSHPDDESIFGGCELIDKEGEYKVVCLDYKSHPERSVEFAQAMLTLGVTEWEMYDAKKANGRYDELWLNKVLSKHLSEKGWVKVVTHNPIGEYKHKKHIQLHEAVASFQDVRDILWCFEHTGKRNWNKRFVRRKREAIKQYKSQHDVLGWFSLKRETLKRYKDYDGVVFHQSLLKETKPIMKYDYIEDEDVKRYFTTL